MTRILRVVDAGPAVLDAVRAALAGGDAILPLPPGEAGADEVPPEVAQRIALVVQTSGSTGEPKRVALSADALLANAAASESALGGPGQWVLALPTHYIAGLNVIIRSIAAGTEPVTVEGEHFSSAAFVDAVARLEVPERYVSLVPAQLATLLDDPHARDALRGFRRVLVGGQATPAVLLDRAREAGVAVSRSYGSSETSGGCVYDGVPIGTTAVRVVDEEVWLGGPSIADGYLGDPSLTDARFVEEDGVRWFRTADEGAWDGATLRITGRRDDVIISGGVKVSLGAVERMLRERPGFTDAVVVPATSERWGEVPVVVTAAVEGFDSAETDRSAVDAVGTALGAAARPERIVRVVAIPVLASGKPDRMALRDLVANPPTSLP